MQPTLTTGRIRLSPATGLGSFAVCSGSTLGTRGPRAATGRRLVPTHRSFRMTQFLGTGGGGCAARRRFRGVRGYSGLPANATGRFRANSICQHGAECRLSHAVSVHRTGDARPTDTGDLSSRGAGARVRLAPDRRPQGRRCGGQRCCRLAPSQSPSGPGPARVVIERGPPPVHARGRGRRRRAHLLRPKVHGASRVDWHSRRRHCPVVATNSATPVTHWRRGRRSGGHQRARVHWHTGGPASSLSP